MYDYVFPEEEEKQWISIADFREKARGFYDGAKKIGMPYSRLVFVATVCSAYELLASGKKLVKFKIIVSAIQKIWRDYSVKTMLKYWKEADMIIRAAWPNNTDVSRAHLNKWENFISRYLTRVKHDDNDKMYAEVLHNVVGLDKQISRLHMEDFAYLLCTIELI